MKSTAITIPMVATKAASVYFMVAVSMWSDDALRELLIYQVQFGNETHHIKLPVRIESSENSIKVCHSIIIVCGEKISFSPRLGINGDPSGVIGCSTLA